MLDELDLIAVADARHLDFTINGRPLSALIDVGGKVGVFGWLDAASEAAFARQLMLRAPSEFPSGRVPLYLCGQCGSLDCGALTTRVVEDHDSFAWLELALEDPNVTTAPTELLDVRPFYFAKDAYARTIRRFWPRGGRR